MYQLCVVISSKLQLNFCTKICSSVIIIVEENIQKSCIIESTKTCDKWIKTMASSHVNDPNFAYILYCCTRGNDVDYFVCCVENSRIRGYLYGETHLGQA